MLFEGGLLNPYINKRAPTTRDSFSRSVTDSVDTLIIALSNTHLQDYTYKFINNLNTLNDIRLTSQSVNVGGARKVPSAALITDR